MKPPGDRGRVQALVSPAESNHRSSMNTFDGAERQVPPESSLPSLLLPTSPPSFSFFVSFQVCDCGCGEGKRTSAATRSFHIAMNIPLKQLHGSTRADFAHLFLKTPGCQDFEILLLSRKAVTWKAVPRGPECQGLAGHVGRCSMPPFLRGRGGETAGTRPATKLKANFVRPLQRGTLQRYC